MFKAAIALFRRVKLFRYHAAEFLWQGILPAVTSLRWWSRHARIERPHGLDAPLVMSLTSYPPRFRTVALTLRCLLTQSIRADHIELWIAEADMPRLPAAVRALESDGLSIRACDDLRSFKKIIPALAAHPDAYIAIADDDTYYRADWLEQLVRARRPEAREVICHRAHRSTLRPDGQPNGYHDWVHNTRDNTASGLIFPTGIGGVFYPPGILVGDTRRADLFMTHCGTSDDIWLFWMAAMGGAMFRKIGPRRRVVSWYATDRIGLHHVNYYSDNGNDAHIARMIARYGFPPGTRVPPPD